MAVGRFERAQQVTGPRVRDRVADDVEMKRADEGRQHPDGFGRRGYSHESLHIAAEEAAELEQSVWAVGPEIEDAQRLGRPPCGGG